MGRCSVRLRGEPQTQGVGKRHQQELFWFFSKKLGKVVARLSAEGFGRELGRECGLQLGKDLGTEPDSLLGKEPDKEL